MSSCVSAESLVTIPIQRDYKTTLVDVDVDQLVEQIRKIASFYSRFFSPEWRKRAPEDLFYQNPEFYPTQEQVDAFEARLFTLICTDCEQSLAVKNWHLTLTNHYYPEKLLKQAVEETLPEEAMRFAGRYFPANCRLTAHYDATAKTLSLDWRGKTGV